MRISKAEPMHRYHFDDVKIGFIDRLLIGSEWRERPDFNQRMFDDDFARLFGSIDRRSGNMFEIVSSDQKLTNFLFSNVKTRYPSRQVDKTVGDLVEEIAQSLIRIGAAYYFLQDDAEGAEVHIYSFSSRGIARIFGTHIQWVPKRMERHWDRDGEELPRELRILDAAKVMRFDLSQPLKHMLAAQRRALAVIDEHQFGAADFQTQPTHEDPNPTNYFDFSVWRDSQERVFYRATRGTGWNGRKSASPHRSDFFDCLRLIRFRRNQIILRDDILKQLSSELSRVGKGYKAEFSIEISGSDELPSVAHLNELEARLAREEVGFTEVIDYCFKH